MVDDIFDGDVAEGSEPAVYVANELMLPVLTQLLHRLGEDAVSYWAPKASRMVCCFLDELRYKPAKDAYLEILDQQSELYGTCTGLSAVSAGADPKAVERAEQFGKQFFKFEQVCLDRTQAESEDTDPWNAWQLMSNQAVLDQLQEWQANLEAYLSRLPDERQAYVRPLVGLDIESWHQSL